MADIQLSCSKVNSIVEMSTAFLTSPLPFNETSSYDDSFHIFAIVLDYLLLIPVFAGNLLMVVCTLRFSYLQTRSYAMVANTAFSDLVFGTMIILFEIISWRPFCNVSQRAVTDTYIVLLRSGLSISLTNLLLITAERYMSVLFPFRYEIFVTKKSITGAIFYSWLSNIFLSLLSVLTMNRNWNEIHQSGSSFPRTACVCESSKNANREISYLWLVYNIFEFFLAIFFYISVVRVTLKHVRMIHPNDDNGAEAKYEMQKSKRRTLALGLFILFWLPFFSIKILEQFCWWENAIDIISKYSRSIFKINYCINFLVYSLTKAYRKAFKEILHLNSYSVRVFII